MMDRGRGVFCSNRETFGISINHGLLTNLGSRNCTLNDLSQQEVFSFGVRIAVGISWLIVILTGAISNILVLFVIAYPKRMRTMANWLLFNLALADSLMTVIALPILGIFQTFHYPIWTFPTWTCYILNCATHIGALASGASLAAISVHRFVVIRLRKKIHLTSKHLYITIALIWILAIAGSASSMTSAGVIGLIRPIYGKQHMTKLCIQVNPNKGKEEFQLAFRVSMYIIYALFLFILYSNIGLFLYRSKSPGNNNGAGKSSCRKRQAVKMLSVATAAMIITYFPYMALVTATLFAKSGYFSPVFGIEILGNLCSSVNHVCNPFIYCAFSSQFREGFKMIFKKILGKEVDNHLLKFKLTSRRTRSKSLADNQQVAIKVEKCTSVNQSERPSLNQKSNSQITLQSMLDSRSEDTSQLSSSSL